MKSHREEAQFGVVVCLLKSGHLGTIYIHLFVFNFNCDDYFFCLVNIQISNAYHSSKMVVNPIIKEAEELKDNF